MNVSLAATNPGPAMMYLGAEMQGMAGQVSPFDAAVLADLLKGGNEAVVFWAAPHMVLADAMRAGLDADAALSVWSQQIAAALALFRKYRRRLVLVDRRLLHSANPALQQPLVRRLGQLDLPVQQPTQDLTGMMAALLAPKLAGLMPFWDELVASSLPIDEPAFTLSDLAPITRTLGAQRDGMAALQTLMAQTQAEGAAEARLLREGLRDLMAALQHSGAEGQSTAHALTVALARLADLSGEVATLRDALSSVTEVSEGKEAETALLRAQLVEVTGGMKALRQIDGAKAETAAAHAEIAILRQQLAEITDAAKPAPDAGDAKAEIILLRQQIAQFLAPAQAKPEVQLLRDQLAAVTVLLSETATPSTPVEVETAIAALLADLVHETELRLQAQQELLAARTTLRSMGLDGAMRPLRLAVAARPTA